MTPLLIAELIAKVGIPAAQQLWAWHNEKGKTVVTAEDWATLDKLASYTSADALAAAGIKIVDGQVVKL